MSGPYAEFLIGCDLPIDKDDTWESVNNLTGSEHIICEYQKQHYWTGHSFIINNRSCCEAGRGRYLKYVTSSLLLLFIDTCMKSLVGDGSIKQPRFGKGHARGEFPVSLAHEFMKSARKRQRGRKRFYVLFDSITKT